MPKPLTDYTEQEIDALQAGHETDALIEESLFGARWRVDPDSGINTLFSLADLVLFNSPADYGVVSTTHLPHRSTDISAAWPVHKAMCQKIFSTRRAYFAALQKVVSDERGTSLIAYPDVLIFVEPIHFCKAALKTIRDKRLRDISNG